MNDRLSDALRCSFNSCINRYTAPNQDSTLSSQVTIPVSEDAFEIPAFVLCNSPVVRNIKKGFVDAVVANVSYYGFLSHYKSLNASFCYNITNSLSDPGLVKLPVKDGETDCYITHGAVFDHNLQPLLMLTWVLQKTAPSERNLSYKCSLQGLYPIVRVAPQVIVDHSHSVHKYIANRVLSSILSLNSICLLSEDISDNYGYCFSPKALIEPIPFTVRRPSVPSVNTSNDDLIHSALDHFDDFIL